MKTGTSLTDAEIIKGLECCGKNPPECHECKYKGKCNRIDCYDYLKRDALDLINRQQATINRLKAENKNCGAKIQNQREQLKACNEKIKEQRVDIEMLKDSIKKVNEYLSEGDFAKGIALIIRLVKEME